MTNPEIPFTPGGEPDLDNMTEEELHEFTAQVLFTPEERKILDKRIPYERAEMLVKQVTMLEKLEKEFGDKMPNTDAFTEFDD